MRIAKSLGNFLMKWNLFMKWDQTPDSIGPMMVRVGATLIASLTLFQVFHRSFEYIFIKNTNRIGVS